MMTYFRGLLSAFVLLTAQTFALAADDYVIDRSHAFVGFEINHLGYSTTIGQFTKYSEKISADWDNVAASSLEVTIDIASLNSGWEARDKHLMSPDFFDVASHPTATFKSTEIVVTGENTATIAGDLTMAGVTKPATLDVVMHKRAPHPFMPEVEVVGITARGTIKRSDWGVSAYVPAVGDEVTLRFEVELNKVAAE